ncbi:MAG: hypothetical protein MHPSP_003166, partial [Paramarteilia canceri]
PEATFMILLPKCLIKKEVMLELIKLSDIDINFVSPRIYRFGNNSSILHPFATEVSRDVFVEDNKNGQILSIDNFKEDKEIIYTSHCDIEIEKCVSSFHIVFTQFNTLHCAITNGTVPNLKVIKIESECYENDYTYHSEDNYRNVRKEIEKNIDFVATGNTERSVVAKIAQYIRDKYN